jgi:hypothetical protein
MMGAVKLPPGPLSAAVLCASIGVGGGMIFGVVRGLAYLPTLPFAIVEGGLLFGIPAGILGLLVMSVWMATRAVSRH